jgi:hypothetical protein
MENVVNAYTINPRDIKPGDVMLFVIKAMVGHDGTYRLYRCRFEGYDMPQGDRLYGDEAAVCKAVFPSLAAVAKPDR